MTCQKCGGPTVNPRATICRACHDNRGTPWRCVDCGRPISDYRATRCRPCYDADQVARSAPENWCACGHRKERTAARCQLCVRGFLPGREVDPVAVDRLCSGDPVAATHAERVEAVRRLTGYGLSTQRIAWRIGVTERTVTRLRAVST